MMRKLAAGIMISLFILPFACSKKDEKSPGAVVTFLLGDAFTFKNNAWDRLDVGAALYEKDRIKTSKASTVDIQMGQSVVRIKENSELMLATLFKDKDTGLESNSLDLTVGMVLAKPKKLVKGESFLVKTPTAVAGVRGTMFSVEASETKNTRVAVIDGKVQVSKRIAALEKIEESPVKDSEIIKQLEAQIEKSSVTVTENKAVEVETKSVEAVNEKVETIVEKVAASEDKKVEVPKEDVKIAMKEIAAPAALKTEAIKEVPELKKEFESMKVVEIPEVIKEAEVKIEKGDLEISVKPDNALIFVNGEMAGSGSVRVSLAPGAYTIRVQAEGYEDGQKELTVAEGKTVKENFALARLKPLDRVRWNLDVKEMVSGLLYSGKSVFIATDKGSVLSINRDSGRKTWERELGSAVTSGIVMERNMLYMSTADEKFHALNIEDGTVAWKEALEGAVINKVMPVATPAAVYVATSRGVVYSFTTKGKMNWKAKTPAGVFETPLMVGGNLLISGSDGKLYSISAAKGAQQWVRDVGSKFKVAYLNDTIYAVSYYGSVMVLNAESGSLLWKAEIGEPVVAHPLILKDRLIIGSAKGKVAALSLQDGAVLFKKNLGGPIRNNMTVTDNDIYISAEGTLFAMDLDGRVQWNYNTKSRIVTAASITGNEIYVGLDNGRIVSLNRNLERVRR